MAKPAKNQPLALGLFKYRFKGMGTLCELQIYVSSENKGKAVADLVEADVVRLEQKYSRYREDSFLSQINRLAASGGEMEVDAETAGLLDYAHTCYQQSDGLFDISSGILRRAWRFDQGQLPDKNLIAGLLEHVGWEKLVWRSPLLSFPQPGMEIDFGGVVKEYAADRLATICQNADVRHGIINLGGDIRVIGPNPDGSPWTIGIQHPRIKGAVLTNIDLFKGGLASSGDYERCIVIEGERYSHIINPKTGWPVKHMAAVSVIANFCLIAGSASTIGMLKEEQGGDWLSELDLPHIWVNNEGVTGGLL